MQQVQQDDAACNKTVRRATSHALPLLSAQGAERWTVASCQRDLKRARSAGRVRAAVALTSAIRSEGKQWGNFVRIFCLSESVGVNL